MKTCSLPLPPPWTLEILSEYIDALIRFITKYEQIAKFNTHHAFTQGLPVDWAPDFDIETWLAILSGRVLEDFPHELVEFIHLFQELPLLDPRKPAKPTRRRDTKGLTPKKIHEVDAMMAFIEETTKAHKITTKNVLDVGSGLGYLSSELSSSGFRVVCVEADPKRAEKAAQRTGLPCIAKRVELSSDLDIWGRPHISVSLHSCGDLSVKTIEHFLSNSNVKLLVNVACCFNLLSADAFPLSNCMRGKNVELSLSLRQLSTAVVHFWNPETLQLVVKKHYYRSVLQVLFLRHGLDPVVGRLRHHAYEKGFQEYVRKVVAKLNLPATFIEEAKLIESYNCRRVLSAFCLSRMCAPVIKSLIVLDRWLMLWERLNDGYVGLHRIFDEGISSQGWAVVAAR